MNHLRQILDLQPDHVGFHEDMLEHDAQVAWRWFQHKAINAICFDLGSVEQLVGFQIIRELVRLPYATCWFELFIDGSDGSRRSWLGALVHSDDQGFALMVVFQKFETGPWCLIGILELKEFNGNQIAVMPPDPEALERIKGFRHCINAFLTALHCKGIRQEAHRPSPTLQAARQRRGKQPLFSYWTLELDLTASERAIVGSGTHASPRFHLRRGHPRQYAVGKWSWVQPHVVGNKELGMVHKDYRARGSLA